jgi:nicotinamidase-related amidase
MFNKYREGEFTEEQVLNFAKNAYGHGDANFQIIPEKCALLVIDMQNEFIQPNWTQDWVPDGTRKVPKIKRMIQHCREKNIPVIYTVYSRTHNYLDRPKTGCLMPGRFPEVKIDMSHFYVDGKVWHELQPKDDEIVIHKPSYGAFIDTPLEMILKNLGKDTVIIVGVIANMCCSMTARQAYERGFKVVFGSDVTGIDDMDLLEYELMVLRKGFAKVLESEEIILLLGMCAS